MWSRTAVLCVLFAVCASALPVAKSRLAAISGNTPANPEPPALSGNFHTKYSIFLLKTNPDMLPKLSGFINFASKLLDGEAWQNADGGVTTIKTITTPTMIGGILAPAMTQVWRGDHGWTQKKDSCVADKTNTQLVIPGTILKSSGVFKGTKNLFPIFKVDTPKPEFDGTYKVDEWFATLPNDEGSVTYYLLHGVTPATPIMSRYRLKGKPPVWAQYHFFIPGLNPASEYVAPPQCTQAALAGHFAPNPVPANVLAPAAKPATKPAAAAAPAK